MTNYELGFGAGILGSR